jgi:outer membrane protein assembly factor BamB
MPFRWMIASLAAFVPAVASADNWPGWRGPRGDGTSTEKGFPLKWSATDHIVWKTPIPGRGYSSPVVWDNRIFLTTCLEGDPKKDKEEPRDRVLLCVNRADGKILWQKTVVSAVLEHIHNENSYASATPATDGKHVYVSFLDFPRLLVACYDLDGNEVWKKSPGEFHSTHGFGCPPVLYHDLVLINGDQDDPKAYLVALDKNTGEERWRAPRPGVRSYCPPLVFEAGGRKQIVMTGSKCVAAYDPDTGKELWIIDGPTEQFVASLIYHKGLFFLTAGFPTYHVMAIKPDGSGNVSNSHVVWHETKGAGYVPSPVAFGDNIFLVHDDGRASCRDALTGELRWLERLGNHHHATPVEAEGRLYFTADDGVTWVLKASSEFEVLSKNAIGESCFASPAFSGGQIFLRGTRHLFCIAQ